MRLSRSCFSLAFLLLALVAAPLRAQQTRLSVGGREAASGIHVVDPVASAHVPLMVVLSAVGSLPLPDLQLGPGCRGHVAPRPDAIVRFSGASTFLRFFVRAPDADVALVVHDPRGRFLCNDDVVPGLQRDPMIDVFGARAGQYDVWIAVRSPGAPTGAHLFVTVDRSQRP